MQITHSFSKQSREQTVNMKFKDWQNFRGMNSLVEERLLQETAVDWWVGTQRYVFLEGVPF